MELIEMKNITKRFPGVIALDNVEFNLESGEVHALIGENGAGKSTLINIISGTYPKTEGIYKFKNQEVNFSDPKEANEYGISTVHQELSLMLEMNVYQNIFLGREKEYSKNGILQHELMRKESRENLKKLGLDINPNTRLKDLSVAQRQLIEIAKAISFDSEIIIFDEPTTALNNEESEYLFEIIKRLQKEGLGIIYISHKMEEIRRIADRVTILRDGMHIKTEKIEKISHDEMLTKMVGRNVLIERRKNNYSSDKKILRVENLKISENTPEINFSLYKGEVLGVAGLVGAGRTELLKSIYGATQPKFGDIYLNDKKVVFNSPREAIDNKVIMLSEDRAEESILSLMSVSDNINISSLNSITTNGIVDLKEKDNRALNWIDQLRIKTASHTTEIMNLSGGNQQKVLLARVLAIEPNIVILDEPTKGIDIGSKDQIYKLIDQIANEGISIIIISSEMPEIIALSDRVIIMHENEIVDILKDKDINETKIIKSMLGGN